MERNTAEIIVKVYAALAWLGTLLLILGAFAAFAIGALGGAGALAGLSSEEVAAAGLFASLGPALGVLLLLLAVAYAVVGFGLWTFKPWARIAAIVISVLSLFSFPFGTVVGAVGIWLFGFEPTVKSLFGTAAPVRVAPTKKVAAKKKQ